MVSNQVVSFLNKFLDFLSEDIKFKFTWKLDVMEREAPSTIFPTTRLNGT